MPRKRKVPSHAHGAAPRGPAKPGDWVDVRGMAGVGRLVELDPRKAKARVLFGDQEWVVDVERVQVTAHPPPPARPGSQVQVVGYSAVRHELDLHGQRVEEALEMVDYALDQAVVHHLNQLKIIHGHGTGRVRTAVRALLARHPHVAAYRFGSPMEGGLACTVAELRHHR